MADAPGQPPGSAFERRKAAFAAFPLYRALGLELVEERPGYARVAIIPGPLTAGGVGGSIHGGILAALVDIAMLAALFPMFEPGDKPAGTADFSITYLRPALGARVDAIAEVLRKGRQLAVTEVSIVGGDGQLCARGRALYAIRRA